MIVIYVSKSISHLNTFAFVLYFLVGKNDLFLINQRC